MTKRKGLDVRSNRRGAGGEVETKGIRENGENRKNCAEPVSGVGVVILGGDSEIHLRSYYVSFIICSVQFY